MTPACRLAILHLWSLGATIAILIAVARFYLTLLTALGIALGIAPGVDLSLLPPPSPALEFRACISSTA